MKSREIVGSHRTIVLALQESLSKSVPEAM